MCINYVLEKRKLGIFLPFLSCACFSIIYNFIQCLFYIFTFDSHVAFKVSVISEISRRLQI